VNKYFGLSESDRLKETVFSWYYRGQLNYVDLYINLFISYNAWFKKATSKNKDRDAINALKERSVIWREYIAGEALFGLRPILKKIVKLTHEQPIENLTGNNRHWDGVVGNDNDWKSLIEYWYRVRCNLFHGAKSPDDYRDQEAIRLAYESLNIFMGEIVRRMESNFSKRDLESMGDLLELSKLLGEKLTQVEPGTEEWDVAYERYEETQSQYSQLLGAFREAFDLWNVDNEESYGR